MRKATAKETAKALWLAVRDAENADAGKAVRKFAQGMKDKGMGSTLSGILGALPNAVQEADIDRRVHLESARELDDAIVARILKAVRAPKNAEVVRSVDPSLISGFRVRTMDRTVDSTAKRMLEDFKKSLTRT